MLELKSEGLCFQTHKIHYIWLSFEVISISRCISLSISSSRSPGSSFESRAYRRHQLGMTYMYDSTKKYNWSVPIYLGFTNDSLQC